MAVKAPSDTTPERPESWTAGPDWFRWKVTRMAAVKETRDAALELQFQDEKMGGNVKPWKFQGYEGRASESIRWGQRGGLLIWECSGDQTPFTLSKMPSSTGLATRIDLQTTLTFSSPQPNFGNWCLNSCSHQTLPPISTGPLVGFHSQTDGLFCGTVGRRTSPKYWRLYDKGIESRTAPAGVKWRLEMEAKSELSEGIACQHLERLTQPDFCGNLLVSSWTSEGWRWPSGVFDDTRIHAERARRPDPSIGQLAIWAGHTVKPTIPRLLTVFSVAEVLELLGLQAVAMPRRRGNAQS